MRALGWLTVALVLAATLAWWLHVLRAVASVLVVLALFACG